MKTCQQENETTSKILRDTKVSNNAERFLIDAVKCFVALEEK